MFVMRGVGARIFLAVLVLSTPTLSLAQSATAAWDLNPAQEGVQSYEVCIGTRSLACDAVRWSVGPAQNWFQFTLTSGVLHLVTVRAVSAQGPGAFAAEIGVSTPRLSPIPDRTNATGTPVVVDVTMTDPDNSGVTFTVGNGVRNGGEPGIPGVVVSLSGVDTLGNPIPTLLATTTTKCRLTPTSAQKINRARRISPKTGPNAVG